MSEQNFVSVLLSTDNILMWICEVQCIIPRRRLKIYYLCVLFVGICRHRRIIIEHVGLERYMARAWRVNGIKVYVRKYYISLSILSGCFIIPYANFHLNVALSDKIFLSPPVLTTAQFFQNFVTVT
jgi:hypothetical protein